MAFGHERHLASGPAAVDGDAGAGDGAGIVRAEVPGHGPDLFGPHKALDRLVHQQDVSDDALLLVGGGEGGEPCISPAAARRNGQLLEG